MHNQKLSNILGLYLGGALIFAGVAFAFVIKPSYKNAVKVKANVAAVNTKSQNLVQLDKDTQTLRQNYSDVKSKSEQILAQLPAKSEEERLLALLSQLAVQNGVVMSSFAPGGAPSSETSALSVYGASVSVTGTYQTVQSFIKSVEYTARFIDIKSVSLAGDKSSVSAGIILQAYYQQASNDGSNKGVSGGK